MNSIRLEFVTKNGLKIHDLTRSYVPRVGDRVQLREGVFLVSNVTFLEDRLTSSAVVEVTPTKIAKITTHNEDNYGNF